MKIILVHDDGDLVAALAENDDEADVIFAALELAITDHETQGVTLYAADTLDQAINVLS